MAGVVATCLGLLTTPAYADGTVSEEAKVYFANGVELLQTTPPSYQDAYYQFKLAYEKSGSWKVLGNLGLCALKLERDGEALANYERYLSEGGNEIEAGERQALVREMALITGNSATVELTFSEPNAEVVVTRAGSNVPPQAYKAEGTSLSLGLRAGTQELVATAPDGRKLEWRFVLSPRTRVVHNFDFDAPAPRTGAQAGPAPNSARDGGSTGGGVRVAGYVVTGAGLIAIGSGVVVGVLSQDKEEDANSECDTMTRLCPDDAARKRRDSGIESAENLAQISNIMWIGGGLITLGGVAMIIFGGPSRSDTGHSSVLSNVAFTPQLGPNGGALFATGRF
jgi:hypothetical protein